MPRKDSRSPARDRDKDRRDRSRSRDRRDKRGDRRDDRRDDRDRGRRDEKEKRREEPEVDLKTEEALMQQMLGFGNFETSKGKDHSNGDEWQIKRRSKRKYRQYMNRRGGFNRPLDAGF